jgi:NAD(P)-dependent dehydrogenase (short-subunit alcohol dehydrogenase family)
MPRSHGRDVVLLEGKNAVIYGGGGAIGGAAARAFAREGARVFLAGRTRAGLDKVAADIRGAGGTAETAQSTPPTSGRSTPTPTPSPPRPAASTSA